MAEFNPYSQWCTCGFELANGMAIGFPAEDCPYHGRSPTEPTGWRKLLRRFTRLSPSTQEKP